MTLRLLVLRIGEQREYSLKQRAEGGKGPLLTNNLSGTLQVWKRRESTLARVDMTGPPFAPDAVEGGPADDPMRIEPNERCG